MLTFVAAVLFASLIIAVGYVVFLEARLQMIKVALAADAKAIFQIAAILMQLSGMPLPQAPLEKVTQPPANSPKA